MAQCNSPPDYIYAHGGLIGLLGWGRQARGNMHRNLPQVRGVDVDGQTRCGHYHGATDIIAIKMRCCGIYYACKDCHIELAGHAIEVWPVSEWDTAAILCGACAAELVFGSIWSASRVVRCAGRDSTRGAGNITGFISR